MKNTIDIRHIEWRAVPGFPGYEVSDCGAIRSSLAAGFGRTPSSPRILKPCLDGHGYLRVYLRRDGRTHSLKVSWLVLAAFKGPRPGRLDACHNDGDRTNDRIGNLRWDTRKGNLADCERHGTRLRGARVGGAKLRDSDIRTIRARLASGESQSTVASAFNVAQSTVSKIHLGARWAWLA